MPYKNKENGRKNKKEYYKKQCANNPEYQKYKKEASRKRYAFIRFHFPWILHWKYAHRRCNNPNYIRYQSYGGKGIRMLLTKEETRKLYIRDKAWKMKKPTIDRIDPDGDYCLDNCQFLERSENTRKGNKERRRAK